MSRLVGAEAPDGLSPSELQRICEFLYARTGMRFNESKRYYIDRRVAERIAVTGSSSFTAYAQQLRSDGAEAEQLINSFTVNETYFYREAHQFRCLSNDILPELVRSRMPGDKIRIWSVPCSTGEEAYSIAIWLLENWRMVDAYNVEIVGSDIDTRALGDAMEAYYGTRALSRLPSELQRAYFEPEDQHRRRLIDDLRESVSFGPVNLVEPSSTRTHGIFDVIFCRNALIYFDDEARKAAVANLYAQLAPGGFICLGHSESMTRITDAFHIRRFEDAIVYQRPERRG